MYEISSNISSDIFLARRFQNVIDHTYADWLAFYNPAMMLIYSWRSNQHAYEQFHSRATNFNKDFYFVSRVFNFDRFCKWVCGEFIWLWINFFLNRTSWSLFEDVVLSRNIFVWLNLKQNWPRINNFCKLRTYFYRFFQYGTGEPPFTRIKKFTCSW